MASNTPVLALPYPTPDDNVDVPRDVKALADKIDAISALRPPVVTSLPGSPIDGQEIYYKTPGGIKWHLRYDTAQGQWQPLGGATLMAAVGAGGAFGTNWTAVGPATITPPLPGSYEIRASSPLLASAAGQTQMEFAAFQGANQVTPSAFVIVTATGIGSSAMGIGYSPLTVTPIQTQARGNGSLYTPMIELEPVWLG